MKALSTGNEALYQSVPRMRGSQAASTVSREINRLFGRPRVSLQMDARHVNPEVTPGSPDRFGNIGVAVYVHEVGKPDNPEAIDLFFVNSSGLRLLFADVSRP